MSSVFLRNGICELMLDCRVAQLEAFIFLVLIPVCVCVCVFSMSVLMLVLKSLF